MRDCITMGYIELEEKYRLRNDDRSCIFRCKIWISWNILLKKLKWYRIKGIVLSWFKSYLKNRTQRVKFNGMLSDPAVKLGVLQGSVLGLIVFGNIIFALYKWSNKVIYDNCEIRLFADDALIYVTGYSSQEINESLNKQMKNIEEWLKINRLQLNVS